MAARVTITILAAALLAARPGAAGLASATRPPGKDALPRFTEEREAAALHFVRKHLPELVPLLDLLKKNQRAAYQREVRAIFQATEILADLRDDPQRYDLELKIWVAENKAQVLAARLNTPNEAERLKV